MDQPIDITPPETMDEIMDAVTRDGTHRVIERQGKDSVIVMSMHAYWDLKLGPASEELQRCWAAAEAAGLDKMTMDEIDEEVAAYRREKAAAEAER